jgi:hypothetical protein
MAAPAGLRMYLPLGSTSDIQGEQSFWSSLCHGASKRLYPAQADYIYSITCSMLLIASACRLNGEVPASQETRFRFSFAVFGALLHLRSVSCSAYAADLAIFACPCAVLPSYKVHAAFRRILSGQRIKTNSTQRPHG